MVAGALAFVLHGHLPYVRSRHPGSLEEDWFFQALTESYFPLIEMLQRSLQAQRANLQLELAESDAAALTMREAAQRDRQAALDLAEHRAEALEEHRIEELRAAKR